MALVSSLVPVSLPQQQMARTGYECIARAESSRRSESSVLMEIEEKPAVEEEEDKVYVAVGKEVKEGKANLLWVFEKISREKKLVIVHIHRPAQKIPMMGAWFPVNQLKTSEVKAYWQLEREKMNKCLDEYIELCRRCKVRAEKLVIETEEDIGKGIVDLIAQRGITELVMGAAADKHYSRKLKELRSKTALSVRQQADRSCKIWFVCKGNLICMRDAGLGGSDTGIMQSPTASSSSTFSQHDKLRSRSVPQSQRPSPNLDRTEVLGQRSRSVNFNSDGEATPPAFLPQEDLARISRSSQYSDRSLFTVNEEGLSNMFLVPTTLKDEGRSEEGSSNLPSPYESEKNHPSASSDLDDVGIVDDWYKKLQQALMEAQALKDEAYEESRKRRKAESDFYKAAHKVREAENLYTKEMKQRKETEESLARARMELEKLKKQRDDVIDEVRKLTLQKVDLELQIDDSDCIVKDFEGKLFEAHRLLDSLRLEHEQLRRERDDAVREAEERNQRKVEDTDGTRGAATFSEFSYEELKEAISDFDDSSKIGEGGYGSVYKAVLRQTAVAIKMLNPESSQGQSEFHQEVDVLSRVRHPNLVTLIGACPEAWALIYEFLPNGSLEDRLACRNNTPPLSWQVRTRIAAEIRSALIFLHSNKPCSVVHGDLKPANILLDANFTSKLGDFGICRLLVQSNTSTTPYCHTNTPRGTIAYMDPEYFATGEITPQSDVYSFGIIILRLLTGKPAFGIISKVREALEKECLDEILDPSAGDWPYVQAKQLAMLGLKCCEVKRKRRPHLVGEAWRVLEPMTNAASSMGSSSLSLRLKAPEDDWCIPSSFICPISQDIMKDPCIAADGFTYEAEAIKGWFDSGHDTSPMTNLKLPHRELVPNHPLRSMIERSFQRVK